MAVVNVSLPELRKRPHWSYSRINALVSHCSLQWAFRYVYFEEPAFTPVSLVFGSAFHRTAACIHARLNQGKDVTIREAEEMFSDYFKDMNSVSESKVKFKETEKEPELAQKGRAMTAVLLENIDRSQNMLGLSVPFTAVLKDRFGERIQKPLIGEFDMLVERGDRTVIVDWKTSACRWSESRAKNCLQATCYLYALAEGDKPERNGCVRPLPGTVVEYAVVTKTKKPVYQALNTGRTAEDFIRLAEIVRVLERRIGAEAFYPDNSSNDCANCPYTRQCREWHRRAGKKAHVDFRKAA